MPGAAQPSRPAREPLFTGKDGEGAAPEADVEAGAQDYGSVAIEGGGEAAAAAPKTGRFPLRLFACCPIGIRAWIPSTWQVIQDSTHLMLVVGLLSCLALVVLEILVIAYQKWVFVSDLLALGAIALNVRYLIKMVGSYDESIQVREKAISDRKQELIDSYEGLVQGIDELLGKATQSSATLAESGFESKRRDFIRFLDRAEERGANLITAGADGEKLVKEFRKFVQQWLQVFAECSVDPINKPKYVITIEELNQCSTIVEIANLTKERLKHTEVRFITSSYEQDAKLLRGARATHKRMSMAPGRLALALNATTNSRSHVEIELAAQTRRPQTVQEDEEMDPIEARRSENWDAGGGGHRTKRCLPCEWFTLGDYEMGMRRGDGPLGYPRVIECKCSQLLVLSQEHLFLMLGFWISILAMIWQIVWGRNWFIFLPLCGYLASIVVLLVMFEQIDILQRLEREIQKLQEEADRLKQRREQMVQFWSDCQNLTDIWVHRTTPRLDLLKEIHSCLEDIKQPKDLMAALSNANTRIETLESRLPELALWRCDGQISEGSKKAFAQRIKRIYDSADQDLPTILSGVSRLVEDGIPTIQAPRANGMAQLSNASGH